MGSPAPAWQTLLAKLKGEIDALKATIQDAQGASLDANTVKNVVELALLRTFSVLEHFIEEVFYLCLLSDPTLHGSGSIIAVTDRSQAELLLTGGPLGRRSFVSWLPLERVLELAETYLLPGHPFDRLRFRQTERKAVDDLVVVRNAVAHADSPAVDKFRALAKSRGYPSSRAADYLQSRRAGQQEVLILMTRVEFIGQGLVALDDKTADLVLDPEAPFQAQQKAPAGAYRCRRCGHTEVQVSGGALGACPSCEPLVVCPTCGRLPTASSLWERIIP